MLIDSLQTVKLRERKNLEGAKGAHYLACNLAEDMQFGVLATRVNDSISYSFDDTGTKLENSLEDAKSSIRSGPWRVKM